MEKSPGQSLLLPEKNIRKWMCDRLHKWKHFLYSSPSVSWRCLSLMDKLSTVFSILPLAPVTSYALFPKPSYVFETNASPLGTATLILLKLPLQDPQDLILGPLHRSSIPFHCPLLWWLPYTEVKPWTSNSLVQLLGDTFTWTSHENLKLDILCVVFITYLLSSPCPKLFLPISIQLHSSHFFKPEP